MSARAARRPRPGVDALEAQVRFWRSMHALALDLIDGPDVETILGQIIDHAALITDSPYAELLVPEGDELVVRAFTANQPFLEGDRVTRTESPVSWRAADTGSPIVLADYGAEPEARSLYQAQGHGPTAIIPIMFGGACLGVLEVARGRDGEPFSETDVQNGAILAQLLGVIIRNAHNRADLQHELLERSAAETALRASEDRYRDLVEHSDILFCTHDLDGRILSVNAAACTNTGYSRERLLEMTLGELVVPEAADIVPLYLARVAGRGRARGVMSIRTADGRRREWVYDNSLRTDGTEAPIVRGIARDETTRLGAVRAARQSEENLRAITSNASVGIVVAQDGAYVYVNGELERMLGYAPGALIGQPFEVVVHPDDRAFVVDRSRRRQAGDDVPSRHEVLGLAADGRLIPFEITAANTTWNGAPASLAFIADITERRRAGAELQSARDRLEATLAAIPDLLFELDGEGRYVDFRANDPALLAVPPEAILGRTVLDTLPPAAAAEVLAGIEEARRNGVSIGRTYALAVPAGLRAFELSIARKGTVVPETFVVLVRDISYRQLVDDALRFLSTGIGPLRGEELYVAMAARAAALLGAEIGFISRLDPDRRTARTVAFVVDGEPQAPIRYDLATLPDPAGPDGQGGRARPHLEHPLVQILGVHHTASIPLLDSAGHPLGEIGTAQRGHHEGPDRDDEVLRFFAVRAAAELERERAEGMFQGLFDFAPDAIVAVGADGTIVDLNTHAIALFGYSREESIGQPIEMLVPHAIRDRHVAFRQGFMEAPDRRIMASDRPELHAVRRDGSTFPVEISLGPIEAEEGLRIVAIVRDVTDRRQAEVERLSLEAQLRQSQRLEAIGTLAGGIAHDFNNILTTIIGNTELAALDAPPGSPLVETLGEIRRAGDRARDLVRQILAFSRRQDAERTAQPLAPIVEEVARLLRAALPAGAALTTVVDPAAPDVVADGSQIHQILMNLGTNAWQALPGGVGSITISLDGVDLGPDSESTPQGLEPGRYARLQVIDTGPGIEPDVLERIFEPFYTTKPLGEGTGLGLAVVHGIVRGHGGVVEARTELGSGTTVEVHLPAVGRVPRITAPTLELPQGGSGQTIAYVDDEPAIVRLTARLLELAGYRVVGFTSAADAILALREAPERFDILLTDLNMPGLSGIELAREVLLLRPNLPIALTSGFLTDELIREAEAVGIREIVHKPARSGELVSAMGRLLPR